MSRACYHVTIVNSVFYDGLWSTASRFLMNISFLFYDGLWSTASRFLMNISFLPIAFIGQIFGISASYLPVMSFIVLLSLSGYFSSLFIKQYLRRIFNNENNSRIYACSIIGGLVYMHYPWVLVGDHFPHLISFYPCLCPGHVIMLPSLILCSMMVFGLRHLDF